MLTISAIIGVISLSVANVSAVEQELSQQREQNWQQEQVYGWQLMTPEERAEHLAKMRSFKTEEDREAYRREHHKRMQKRARERGVPLSDVPAKQGSERGLGGGGMGSRGGGRGR